MFRGYLQIYKLKIIYLHVLHPTLQAAPWRAPYFGRCVTSSHWPQTTTQCGVQT